jgi:hypothetical protein
MREIRESAEFRRCVEELGVQKDIDEILDPITFGLSKNPYAFRLLENDWVRVRYAVTRPIGRVPALVVVFSIIDRNTVELIRVEKLERY